LMMKGWSLKMNEALRVIKNRRSIRQYKEEQISDAQLQEILDAALLAPNAMNMQVWHFTVIQDRGLLERIVGIVKGNLLNSGIEFLAKRASTPGYNTFYSAPTVIMISGSEKAPFIQVDCGAAAQNIALAAESLDIGSCVMTSPAFLFASPEGNDLKEELGIPDGYVHVCTVALGYKGSEHPLAPPRKQDVVNYLK
jgi:nitroreductase